MYVWIILIIQFFLIIDIKKYYSIVEIMPLIELNLDIPFSPAYGIITMNPNTFIYYRGYLQEYPVISDRPAYYGTINTAKRYSSGNNRTLSVFTNRKPLRLVDIRFMKEILRELFSKDHANHDTVTVTLSLGLCSLNHQLRLLKNRYPDTLHENIETLRSTYRFGFYEQPGVRIGETNNDSYTMSFLKTLFEGHIDGFISPAQDSAFHIEQKGKLHAEMIIFNPKASGIYIVNELEDIPYTTDINYLYGRHYNKKLHIKDFTFYIGGGDPGVVPSVEKIAEELYTNPEIQKEWEQGQEAGKRWRKLMDFSILNKSITTGRTKTRRQKYINHKCKQSMIQRGGIAPLPSVTRIDEEIDTNPVIKQQWELGKEAALRFLSNITVKKDENTGKLLHTPYGTTAGSLLQNV